MLHYVVLKEVKYHYIEFSQYLVRNFIPGAAGIKQVAKKNSDTIDHF